MIYHNWTVPGSDVTRYPSPEGIPDGPGIEMQTSTEPRGGEISYAVIDEKGSDLVKIIEEKKCCRMINDALYIMHIALSSKLVDFFGESMFRCTSGGMQSHRKTCAV